MRKIIESPQRWDEKATMLFLRRLEESASVEDLHLDLRPTTFVEPLGVLLMAEAIKTLAAERRKKHLKTLFTPPKPTSPAHSYLRFFGFYEYIKGENGNFLKNTSGNKRYVPLMVVREDDLIDSFDKHQILQYVIHQLSEQLAEVLFTSDPEQIMASYCFREVIRNVFEHAETNYCIVMAQRWPQLGEAEIVVLDHGIGIYGTLAPTLDIETVDDALSKSLLPGISSKLSFEIDDYWANSGYGLYILSQLGRMTGEFFLASNNRYIRITSSPNSPIFGDMPYFAGTVVKIRVSFEEAEFFPNILKSIVETGEKISPTGRKASASSQIQ